jgi:c-di-GMP-binding flagellar brake protein YcgR
MKSDDEDNAAKGRGAIGIVTTEGAVPGRAASYEGGGKMATYSVDVERRDYFRVDVALPVAYWRETDHVQTKLDLMPVNISGSGMRLVAERPMAVGDTVSLRIGLPSGVVPAQAKVVRVQGQPEKGSSVSMQFTAIGSHDQERLLEYMFAA